MAGRPRSARAHGRVLDAAVSLFAERGIDGASMDAIARTSGVSKATIYKHWPNKDALALETLEHLHRMEEWDDAESPDVSADIETTLARKPTARTAALRGAILPHLMAYAARNPAFNKAWRMRMIEPLRARVTRLLERAVAEGRLAPDFNCNVGVAFLLGPMLYTWLSTTVGATLPDDLPSQIVDGFWRAHGVAGARETAVADSSRSSKLPPSRRRAAKPERLRRRVH